jgi:GLPGLI family protein
MKNPLLTFLILTFALASFSQQRKIISDCTISYTVSNTDLNSRNAFENTVKTIFISGKQIRIDLKSTAFSQTIFYNDNTGEATVLKSIGESKYISNYSAAEWQKENAVYHDIKIIFTKNIKKILGYNCKEAVLQLKNGSKYMVYYVPDIILSVTENNFEFKNVPGLILQYETSAHDKKIVYTANQLSFDPVPAFRFEIPKSGYKILN